MEAEILTEIKDAEARAEEAIKRAAREKDSIIHSATINSSKLLLARQEEIKKAQEKKIADFREKAKLIREEKLAEGKNAVKQLRLKSEKNTQKAVEFVLKKFEEMI